jgi:large subunit ribosomal protein L35
MPKIKQKTKKAIAKRVKVTARGKLMKHAAGSGHLKSRKSPRRLRKMRKATAVSKAYAKQVRMMLGV